MKKTHSSRLCRMTRRASCAHSHGKAFTIIVHNPDFKVHKTALVSILTVSRPQHRDFSHSSKPLPARFSAVTARTLMPSGTLLAYYQLQDCAQS